jgi:aspartate aminotransferase-like enzyme
MTPGPTPVPEFIRFAMAQKSVHHRTSEFEAIFSSAREGLKRFTKQAEVLLLASTGTGAMEAAVTHFCKTRILTVNAGKFGERFTKIAKAYGKNPLELKYEWNTPASIEDIESALKSDPNIDAVAIQICESAGGLRHPAEEIAKRAKEIRSDIFIIADGITAVGVEPIDASNIDALIAGSQKAFMIPPGLAIISLSQKAVDHLDKNGGSGFYFNLATELKNQRKNTTAWTAATTLVQGLDAMLKRIEEIGMEKFYADTRKRHTAGLEALKAMGLFIYPKTPSLAMLTVLHNDAANLRKWMKKEAFVNVGGGQDDLKDKLIRINNMGLVEPSNTAWSINALEIALHKANIRTFDGVGSKVFCERYFA